MRRTETYIATVKDQANRKWLLVDAAGKTLGRLATRLATVLMGKHKPTYSSHLDMGDFLVVVNAEKVVLTGKKMQQKVYQRYSGFAGGRTVTSIATVMAKHPERVLYLAVKRMVPATKLGNQMIRKLHVYAGPNHPHEAQKPEKLA
ncbi:MAG: 50S ribosomal protein L13 [Planctomycetota bacterium]|nr:50S ribosomal protein L13 [Planctomycetota bacterium]